MLGVPFLLFVPTAMAVAVPVAAVAALAMGGWREARQTVPPRALAIVLAAAGIWAAASLVWTLEPGHAALKFGRLAVLMALGLALIAVVRRAPGSAMFQSALSAGMLVGVVLLLFDRFGGAPIMQSVPKTVPISEWPNFLNNYNRGMTVAALFVWPAILALSRWRRTAGIGLWLLVAVLLPFMDSAAATLAFAAGTVVYGIVRFGPPRTLPILGAAAAVMVMLAPVVAETIPHGLKRDELPSAVPSSAFHRLLIWRFATDRIQEKTAAGWGFDSSRAIPGGDQSLATGAPALPLHPHNAALQWWLELGIPGAVLGAAASFLAFAAGLKMPTAGGRAAAGAAATSGFTIAMLSYGIWQSWWVGTLFLAVVLIASVRGPEIASDRA